MGSTLVNRVCCDYAGCGKTEDVPVRAFGASAAHPRSWAVLKLSGHASAVLCGGCARLVKAALVMLPLRAVSAPAGGLDDDDDEGMAGVEPSAGG